MAEKKLTPIQEAIESIEWAIKEGNFSPQETGVMSGIKNSLQLLLPKEKEFAMNMFNAAKVYNGPYPDDVTYESFDEYFKQYEP